MKIEIFTLCDAATVDSNGKLNILGAFDTLSYRRIPIVHPVCALVTRCRFEPADEGTKQFRISIITPNATPVFCVERETEILVAPDKSATFHHTTISLLMKLPCFGEYSVRFEVNSQLESIPLYVRKTSRPPAMNSSTPASSLMHARWLSETSGRHPEDGAS